MGRKTDLIITIQVAQSFQGKALEDIKAGAAALRRMKINELVELARHLCKDNARAQLEAIK